MNEIDINTKNLIPIHKDLDEDEIEFAQKYSFKFAPRLSDDLSDITTIVLHTTTFRNFIIDVLRDYEDYLTDKYIVDNSFMSSGNTDLS